MVRNIKSNVPRGFTLVELLVVMAVLAILASLLLPVLSRASEQGKHAACLNNLREIGHSTLMYVDDNKVYPPIWIDATNRWPDLLKPYLGKTARVYLCPADPFPTNSQWDTNLLLSYGMNTYNFNGSNTCFWYGVRANLVRRPAGIILYADCSPGKYYCGSGSNFTNPVPNVEYRHLKRYFDASYCDGHVETKLLTTREEWDASQ